MGLDLGVVEGDEVFFGERMSSYSGFDDFRQAWARLLGFDLDDMQGFAGTRPWTTEPLQCFFDHSDCEGEISWQDAQQILERAQEDAPKLPDFARAFGVLIRACEAAVAHKLPISFCYWLMTLTQGSPEPDQSPLLNAEPILYLLISWHVPGGSSLRRSRPQLPANTSPANFLNSIFLFPPTSEAAIRARSYLQEERLSKEDTTP